ncbi:MAG TPA: YbhB/YbcL family Raf kinase inhibitor-like protein [Ilumatobacteraceae bacterium]|nr:YbhB/YbcL family Raf kinase inhibitor-like protein [Ilumatobacteraceae bacterium]
MRRHTAQRSTAVAVAIALAMLVAGCDTGDGKQLRPYDPADYPAPTPTTEVASSVLLDDDLGGGEPSVAQAISDTGLLESFTLTAPWLNGSSIDARYTCDGPDVAPPLSWGGLPDGTVEIALTMVDDSAVSDGQPFVHWAIAGLDPNEIALAEGDVPAGATQALNFFGDVGYGGPCPPPGDDAHLYRFTAYALNSSLQLADGALATEFLEAIAQATITSTDLIGTRQR